MRRKADGALKNHRHSQRDESFCYRRYVSVSELHVEDSRSNDARLQQFQRRIGASDRADDLTPGVFNQCLELERDEQLVSDNDGGCAIEQPKTRKPSVPKVKRSIVQSFHWDRKIHNKAVRVPFVGKSPPELSTNTVV